MVMLGSPPAILTMELLTVIGMARLALRLVIHISCIDFTMCHIFHAYVLKLLETSTIGDGSVKIGDTLWQQKKDSAGG